MAPAGRGQLDRPKARREHRHVATRRRRRHVEPLSLEVDDELRLIFLCSIPSCRAQRRFALTLRTAFASARRRSPGIPLDERKSPNGSCAQRGTREAHVSFELPEADELPRTRDAILDVLYQLFT